MIIESLADSESEKEINDLKEKTKDKINDLNEKVRKRKRKLTKEKGLFRSQRIYPMPSNKFIKKEEMSLKEEGQNKYFSDLNSYAVQMSKSDIFTF